MRTILVLQNPDILPMLEEYIAAQEQVLLIVERKLNSSHALNKNTKAVISKDVTRKTAYTELGLTAQDRVIVYCNTVKELRKTLAAIRSVSTPVSLIALLSHAGSARALENLSDVSCAAVDKLLHEKLSSQWLQIENRKKIARLHELTEESASILILTQHDPDPDALASGLAFRALLGRTSVTAPIGSFGEVTRSENQTMMQLLDIEVIKVTSEMLKNFSTIAMLDVQPSYFADSGIKADIIIDHHPQLEKYTARFCDIRVNYGATATILAEYLLSGGYKINQRVATALIYGIKTDTLFLGRDINHADIEVFTDIYPIANRQMILQMEHPRLQPDEINSFILALKGQKLIDRVVFAHLGRIGKEDIIARLADFCLQIDRAEWSVISAVVERNLIICVRNVGYIKHAGEVTRRAFESLGSAGGHRSMARAVIPLREFKQHYRLSNREEIGKKIIGLFLKGMEE